MYFSNPFGITLNLSSTLKTEWLSQSLKFWNITGTFLVNWKFMLQSQWAVPLNLPVTWQWSLSFSSSLLISFLQVQQQLLCWDKYYSFRLMIKFLLKCLSTTFLQYSHSLRIALINSQAAFSPLWTTVHFVNLSSTQLTL